MNLNNLSEIIKILGDDKNSFTRLKSRISYKTFDMDFNKFLYDKIKTDFNKKKKSKNNSYSDLKLFFKVIKYPLSYSIYYFVCFVLISILIVYVRIYFINIVSSTIRFLQILASGNNRGCFTLIYNFVFSLAFFKLMVLLCSTLFYRIRDKLRLDLDTVFLLKVKEEFISHLLKKNCLFFNVYGLGKIVEIVDQSISGVDDLLYLFLDDFLPFLLNVLLSFGVIISSYLNGCEYFLLFILNFVWLFLHFCNMFYYTNIISDMLYLSNKYHLVCNSILTDILFNLKSIKRSSNENLEKKVLFKGFFAENLYDRKVGRTFNKVRLLCSISLVIFRVISILGIFYKIISFDSSVDQYHIEDLIFLFTTKYEFSSSAHELIQNCIFGFEFFFRVIPNFVVLTNSKYDDDISFDNKRIFDDILNDDMNEQLFESDDRFFFNVFFDKNVDNNNLNNLKNKYHVIPSEDLRINKIEIKNLNLILNNVKVLNNISLVFENDKRYGLVGYSGSGKTTLLNALSRLYDVSSGCICYNDIKISNYSKKDWLSLISYVPQTPLLFNRTILENIIYGVKEFTLDELIKACKSAYIYDFIMSAPGKFGYVVGNKGDKVSGGQRQRIMLARSFLNKNNKIILIDEATSALDSKTENIVLKSINSLVKDKISIFISHDIEQFKSFDSIIVLDKGYVVEQDTFDNLLKKKGFFAKLWEIHEAIAFK